MKNNMPKITVLMSVYNDEKYLQESIDSILNQTFKEFEFLIINDGSTDNSLSILKENAKKDLRIKLIINEQNIGLIASLNKGLQLASCDLVARMDSDDIAVSTRLEAQYQFMLQHPEVSVCGGAFIYQEEPDRINTYPEMHSEIVVSSLYDCSLAHPTIIYRKQDILSVGGYDKADLYAEDYGLWVNLIIAGKFKLHNLPIPLLYYRTHPNVDRSQYKAIQKDTAERVGRKLLIYFGIEVNKEDYSLLLDNDKKTVEQVVRCKRLLEKINQQFNAKEYRKELIQKNGFKKRLLERKVLVTDFSSFLIKLSARWYFLVRKITKKAKK
ncbi:TPA: glycosyltransferase [Proteus mirabilis]|uniref:glycosyltransferase n=2 Tax=Gammaproteobacteria TaxID=1236 RepID=UPI0015829E42|nr:MULTISPECIES: glycosyltransferase [Enterobacterales]EKX4458059.1 glycosyltransferase [Proteus mirabilis]EKX4632930.1 glycosyltransferase [Proteus mirabilis]ELB4966999.1 glycosyltransferase [Proteus mirabilis]ELI8995179.1 glycosyltransferase [Proteus mirabilis]MCL8566783.1 glycosyltransferase [Proteus mirabilis]